jgi:hypothetical protein
MNDLLKLAVEAHGGLDRWKSLTNIRAKSSITGAMWGAAGRADVLKNVEIDADTRVERLTMSFPGQSRSTTFEPSVISIQQGADKPEICQNPVKLFAEQPAGAPWQDAQVAYFSGEALWTYLTIPFLYTYPGFVSEEIEPWYENGEMWRRLKVIFPDNITSHTKEQISFFGPDGLLRRHDYTIDYLGGAQGAKYSFDYHDVAGIKMPGKHRVCGYEGDHIVQKEPLLVAIDLCDISLVG